MPSPQYPATRMTHADLVAWVRESRREQGLPEKVEDPAIIAKLIALMTARGWPPPARADQPDDLAADQLEAAA
jgi:hypothetical protein